MNKIMQEIEAALISAVETDDSGVIEARYRFTDQFCGFGGHFPGHPILPAIVEILTVVSLASKQAGCRQRLIGVEDAKFLVPVTPNQEILVRCHQRTIKGKLLFDGQLTVAGKTTATMLLDLASEDSP